MHAQALLHSQLDKVLIGARQTWLDVIEDAKYQKIVSEIETLENKLLENWEVPFGRQFREKHFMLAKECNYLNHGSYGATLKIVAELRRYYQDKCDQNPNKFMDVYVCNLLHRTRIHLAAFVGCASEDLVLISNATTAFATVLRAFPFTTQNDTILICAHSYSAVKKMIYQVAQEKHLRVVCVEITDCLASKDQLCERVEHALRANPHVKLAVFDHIISETAVTLPVQSLTQICHRRGVRVAVDGAHAVGNIQLNVKEIGADFYWSNCHKWLCTSLGCAFLYMASSSHDIRPLVISHGYPNGRFQEFAWHGTDDYTQFFGIPLAIKLFNKIGFEKVIEHNHKLSIAASTRCAEEWNTALLCPASSGVFNCMSMVRLPRFNTAPPSGALAGAIRSLLRELYDVELPIIMIQDEMYARISAHVYYELSDYQIAIDAVFELDTKQSKLLLERISA